MNRDELRQLQNLVREAFFTVHDGWSPDDVLIDDDLNRSFIAACRQRFPEGEEEAFNHSLLNLRRSRKLKKVTTKRRPRSTHEAYLHASQIAARRMEDRYETTIDRVLCNPSRRQEFDRIALDFAPEVAPYWLRKAALYLRKTNRLKPDLIKQATNWVVARPVLSAEQIMADPALVPSHPGIYIISDRKSGYLYIGEAENLNERVLKHLDHSDRKSLAHYFWANGLRDIVAEMHVFDPQSDGRERRNRRAYETDLIRNRAPRFNLAGNS